MNSGAMRSRVHTRRCDSCAVTDLATWLAPDTNGAGHDESSGPGDDPAQDDSLNNLASWPMPGSVEGCKFARREQLPDSRWAGKPLPG